MANPYQSPASSEPTSQSAKVAQPVRLAIPWVAALGLAPWVLFYIANDYAVWGVCGNVTFAELQQIQQDQAISRSFACGSVAAALGITLLGRYQRSPVGLILSAAYLACAAAFAAYRHIHHGFVWP